MIWRCECGEPLAFTLLRCRNCRRPSVYNPRAGVMQTLDSGLFRCANIAARCNWLTDEKGEFCFSCRLTRLIPPQTTDNRLAWRRFERAKRRLIAALWRLQLLPRHAVTASGKRLEINLLQDRRDNPYVEDEFVLTGHINGVIVINMRETDLLRVEEARRQFREKYRTLLGSLRHESGHYFWQEIVSPKPESLNEFRSLFGDERQDYQAALSQYYQKLPREHSDFASAYARMHPHEDWAETWAHYLHMEDALAMATAAGMIFPPTTADEFDDMLARWKRLAAVANALTTALGHRPAYPFRVTDGIAKKLRFVHLLIRRETDN